MSKKLSLIFALLTIIVFIGYIIFDSVRPERITDSETRSAVDTLLREKWKISNIFKVNEGMLKAVAASRDGNIYLGGDSFLSCYDADQKLIWNLKTPSPITSLSVCGDTVYASTMELILIVSKGGELKNEWGPFEDKSNITSVSSNKSYVAFADAGNKMVVVLDRGGEVKKIIGQNSGEFIIPSPYFDVALGDGNILYVANTGHRRVESRTIQGDVLGSFGEPGLAPDAFCGCCNPAHFIPFEGGFVTAEKGINRIKILNARGEFVEFVSSKNNFEASVPLDIATSDGNTIYAANPADSKLYTFIRKSLPHTPNSTPQTDTL